MKTETEIRQALREWIVQKNGKIGPEEIDDEMPLIERRILASVHVLDLILFLEELRGSPIDAESLRPGAFRSVSAIYRHFFPGSPDGC